MLAYIIIIITLLFRCAVLFCEAIARDEPLPCKSAEEYVVTAPVVAGW